MAAWQLVGKGTACASLSQFNPLSSLSLEKANNLFEYADNPLTFSN